MKQASELVEILFCSEGTGQEWKKNLSQLVT